MITGAHVVLFTEDAEADRAFLRDALGFPSVDAGHGWLIFRLPPSEVAVHPVETEPDGRSDSAGEIRAEFYLMCEDLQSAIASLQTQGVDCAAVDDEGWGLLTSVRLPSGSRLGLYQPRHPTALDL